MSGWAKQWIENNSITLRCLNLMIRHVMPRDATRQSEPGLPSLPRLCCTTRCWDFFLKFVVKNSVEMHMSTTFKLGTILEIYLGGEF